MEAIMYNATNFLPFVFHFNPEKVKSTKKSEWHKAPNIGGASKKNFFTGFDNRTVSFEMMLLDQASATGLRTAIDWFEQLSEPDAGLVEIAGSFGTNENFPPPQVYFQFGVSLVPLKWDVINLEIDEDIFKGDGLEFFGFPERAICNITLELDTDDPLAKANQISKTMSRVSGSVASLYKEFQSIRTGQTKETISFL